MSQPFDNRDHDVQQLLKQDAEIAKLKALITELADALEEECSAQDYNDLIQRAREATK